jgi:hypothetical protein
LPFIDGSRSPDGAKRNPGRAYPAARSPDGASAKSGTGLSRISLTLHPGYWIFPIDVLGMSVNTTWRGHLKRAMTVNGPWRICFEYRIGDAYNVEIVDYHKG